MTQNTPISLTRHPIDLQELKKAILHCCMITSIATSREWIAITSRSGRCRPFVLGTDRGLRSPSRSRASRRMLSQFTVLRGITFQMPEKAGS